VLATHVPKRRAEAVQTFVLVGLVDGRGSDDEHRQIDRSCAIQDAGQGATGALGRNASPATVHGRVVGAEGHHDPSIRAGKQARPGLLPPPCGDMHGRLSPHAEVVGGQRRPCGEGRSDHTAHPSEARWVADASHMRVAEEEDAPVCHGASYASFRGWPRRAAQGR
jgi:hypothetical protein